MRKQPYHTPQLTVIEFKAEWGYAFSPDVPLVDQLNIWVVEGEGVIIQDRQNNVEVYETGHNWAQGSNHFWD